MRLFADQIKVKANLKSTNKSSDEAGSMSNKSIVEEYALDNLMPNLVNGSWAVPDDTPGIQVSNPATGNIIATVPDSTAQEVDRIVQAAHEAFISWSKTPAVQRIQILFKLKGLLEDDFENLSQIVTKEHGKTLSESRGEVRRAIENLDVAVGVPTMMQGTNLEDVASGIDEYAVRQPLGVFAAIAPFNFPAMVPMWFLPYAIACGNTFLVKPSEQAPLSQVRIAELAVQAGLPNGVLSLVHGGRSTVEAILDHPLIAGASFVGSTPVARSVYERGTQNGKRMQCQGGAKNYLVVMPDAQMDPSIENIVESAFGCAGQRCLAGSVVVAVGEAYDKVKQRLLDGAKELIVGDGSTDGVHMGPVISENSRTRILKSIENGINEGADMLLDGRGKAVPGHDSGYFLGPTLFADVTPDMSLAKDEIFGPVLSVMHADNLDAALDIVDAVPFGNMACIFTSSGKAARQFSSEVKAGNVGINIGVAAPMAFFHFGGMKDSFFGDLHGQGRDAVDFFTEDKVVIERWY